jgi:hypothetical protein
LSGFGTFTDLGRARCAAFEGDDVHVQPRDRGARVVLTDRAGAGADADHRAAGRRPRQEEADMSTADTLEELLAPLGDRPGREASAQEAGTLARTGAVVEGQRHQVEAQA